MFLANTYGIAIASSTLAIVYALFLITQIKKSPEGDEKMKDIAAAIKEGAEAFLKRQYTTVGVVALILFAVIWYFLNTMTAIGFLIGAVASALAGFIGMAIAVRSNSRTAEAAKKGMDAALKLAFKGGSVTGFLVAGLALLSVTLFLYFGRSVDALIGLGFGASLISVFARLAGGIYTKAADVGADLVGKLEAGIPEDDPRNPAVIADNVGDNVGDDAGMAADLFETYVVSLIAAMLLANFVAPGDNAYFLYPLLIGSVAIVCGIIGSFFVKLGKDKNIMKALYKGLSATVVLSAIAIYFISKKIFAESFMNIFVSALIGFLVTILMVMIVEYYTSKKFNPIKRLASASTTGHGTNIIAGLALSMQSTALPVLVIIGAVGASFYLSGLYGIAVATMSMLSLTAIIVSIDAFGPITDNAGGIAEMSGLSEEVREITDALDAVGNTTKAVTKGYAIASAGLAAVILFTSYIQEIIKKIPNSAGEMLNFNLIDPSTFVMVLTGIFIGALLPYIFASSAMQSVGTAAKSVVEEVRRQFKEIPGILEGTNKPNYAAAVDIVTKAALKEMIYPALIPIITTLLVGFILGPKALGGLLIGSIVSGLFLALSMTTGGAAWDNTKKYIEEGHYGGKKSFAHQAAVTGDMVGDPYKDTAGPAINPMIKVINIVALLIASFII
ncbi:MAG: sodium-translocating pyrophosphatase [Parcubacteria group bacterium]|nr:sodium-translocating pyrophosphatase [Parcubacteria group bacterium]